MAQRVGGIIQFQIGGVVRDAKGSFTYNLGHPKREAVAGADVVHGYKEMPQASSIEGVITDRGNLDVAELVTARDIMVTLELGNGKTIALADAWYAGDGNITTEEGEIEVRFEGATPAKEV